MSENAGIIYDLGGGRYGLAKHKEQLPEFKDYNKVYMKVFLDPLCTIPEKHPETGKDTVTLKHISKIKAIGFSD